MKFGNQKAMAPQTPGTKPQNPNRDLMLKFLNSGMSTSMQSGSPALAAIAPLLTALMMRQGGMPAGAGGMDPFTSGFQSSNEDLAAYLDDPSLPDWRRDFYVEEMKRRMEAERAGGGGRPRPGYTPVAAPAVAPPPDVKPTPTPKPAGGGSFLDWIWGPSEPAPDADPFGITQTPPGYG